MTIQELYGIFKGCSGVATDSRKIKGGELFFALKGENFDGNVYAVRALEAGASHAVIDSDSETAREAAAGSTDISSRLIPVPDTLKTLQELARWHRSMTFVNGRPIPVIGLTGTNGKTTTKELIKAVLSVKYKVTATEGNLNNSIGVPLSLLKIDDESEIAIIEMGASHPGDIKELVSICLPDYGLVTNVGKAHLLGFGSFEGVMKAKGELYDYIQRTADKVFINTGNPDLCKMAEERPDLQLIPYGLDHDGAEIMTAGAENPYLRIRFKDEGLTVSTCLIGNYNADNVLAAMAVGSYFGISHKEAAKAISRYVPDNNRSQMVRRGTNDLIIDAYNANPTSMDAAIRNFAMMDAPHKVLMLGDMLELGDESTAEHRIILEKIKEMGPDAAFLVGDEFRKAGESAGTASARGTEIMMFPTSEALSKYLASHKIKESTILIKGSRGTRMETVLENL